MPVPLLTKTRVERVAVPAPLRQCIDLKADQVPAADAPHIEIAEFLPVLAEAYLDCKAKVRAIDALQTDFDAAGS